MDKTLFRVNEYYKNGTPRLIGNSITKSYVKFQGPLITFFSNGHRMRIENFLNGNPVGDIFEYYPNGRFYNKKSYLDTVTEETILQFKDCRDSTGKVLAENGNGHWITYNDDFTREAAAGKIVNGFQDSVWGMNTNENVSYSTTYKNGKIIGRSNGKISLSVETVPEFPGGIEAFYKFLYKNIKYPIE
ncbi:MAG TPA: hypothetical protein VGI43_19590, partial [Mucilaginibacter sp.]